jgi:V/A-type H+-transporting ATPase subunit E
MSEAIVAKILEDARASVNTALSEGGKAAAKTIADAQNEASILLQKSMEDTAALREEIIRRRISVANLEVRKLMLAAKKRVLDRIFAEAAEKIASLPKDRYLALIRGMLNQAEDGDEVRICERDAGLITKEFIDGCAKARGIRLTLSSSYADIRGGILLSAGGMEKNLSLEVEMAELRERLEPEVAARLFG